MSLFDIDLQKTLRQLAHANEAQRHLATKAWDRLLATIPNDATIAQMQQTHFGKGKNKDEATNDRVLVTNILLKRFAQDCGGFAVVSITSTLGSQDGDGGKQKGLALNFAMPTHEMLYYLRIIIACCLPREGSVGPNTSQMAAKLANAVVEVLMALLQLLLPTNVLDDVRDEVKAGRMQVALVDAPSVLDPAQRPSKSPTTTMPITSPTSSSSSALAAFQALEILQLPHTMWRAPKPLPASELVEKGSSGGFFGKLFRGNSSSAGANSSASDAAQEMVDIRAIIKQQRYLVAVDELPTTSAGVTATIGDFFAMALCLKIVPLLILFMPPPSSPTPNITIPLGAAEGNPIVASVGYGAQQVQGLALLAQTIVGVCAGVVPAYAITSAYQPQGPLQTDINAYMTQSLTSTTSVSPSTGQRVFIPHGFSLTTTPASYPISLLPTTHKNKGSGCSLDTLQIIEQPPQPELRVSDVVAVSALTAVSLLHSMCVVPVPVAIAVAPSTNVTPTPQTQGKSTKGNTSAQTAAALIADQQAYTYTVVASSPPPAIAVALGALLSAIASPTRYLRSIVTVVDSSSSPSGGILVTPSPSAAGGDYIGLLMGGDPATHMESMAAHKANEARAHLLFLVATCSFHLTTNPSGEGASSLVSFLRTSIAELDASDPATRTSQRLLDGLRVAQAFAAKVLAIHRARRSLIATTSIEVGVPAIVDAAEDCATTIGTTIEVPKPAPSVNPFISLATPDDASPGEGEEDVVAVEFQSTMLNALLSIFVNCGPSVRGDSITLSVVQRLVFPMLLETSLRPESAIHRVSFSLYLAIRRDFRGPHTVAENGSFFTHVIFFLLESKNARAAHKRLVLQLLMKVAEEPRDLVEIFLNYDCDKNYNNVFETLVKVLSELTCGTARPTLPSLNAPAMVQYGTGGVPPPPAPAGIAPSATPSSAFIPVSLPTQADSLYMDALNVVLLLPNAVRQWIERFEDSIKLQEADEQRERQMGTLQAIEDTEVKGTAGHSSVPTALSSDILEQHRLKRLFNSFFDLFNVREKPNEAIALISNGSLPLAMIEAAIADALSSHKEELASYVLVDRLAQPETAADSTQVNMSRLIARFLHAHADNIDKIVLGEYFSKMSRKDEIKKVFTEWVNFFDFTRPLAKQSSAPVDPRSLTTNDIALPIDEALRSFLGGFKILGEAQVVDKTMELFASHYSDSVKAAVAVVEQRWAEANPAPSPAVAIAAPIDTMPLSPVVPDIAVASRLQLY